MEYCDQSSLHEAARQGRLLRFKGKPCLVRGSWLVRQAAHRRVTAGLTRCCVGCDLVSLLRLLQLSGLGAGVPGRPEAVVYRALGMRTCVLAWVG